MDNPLYGLQREMNRVFSDFFDDFSLAPFGDFEPLGMFSPRVDVAETDKEIKVSAELPGLEDQVKLFRLWALSRLGLCDLTYRFAAVTA